MTHLQHGDYLALLRFIAEVSAAYSLDDFRKRAAAALRHLVPAEVVPSEIAGQADMHPGERARGAVEPSDVHFAEGEEIPPDRVERDRLLLDLARPHLIQAERNAVLLDKMQEAMAHGGQAMIALDRAGGVVFATRGAECLLGGYFGDEYIRGSALPEGLREWIGQERKRQASGSELPRQGSEHVVEREGRRLVARLAPSGRESEGSLVLLIEERGREAADLSALGLSAREAEVLHLVAQGKTDAQIAEALVVSPRTVHKHLEHVYGKLGVRTRTAAVSRAFGRGSAISLDQAAWPSAASRARTRSRCSGVQPAARR